MTKVLPDQRSRAPSRASRRAARPRGAASRAAARVVRRSKNSRTASAITVPTPCDGGDLLGRSPPRPRRSSRTRRPARAPPTRPTCRMPKPKSSRSIGRSLAAAIAAEQVGDRLVLEAGSWPISRASRKKMSAGVLDEAALEQLARGPSAEVLDVHGAARGEVDDARQHLRGAQLVRAAGDGLALGPDDRRLARPGSAVGMTNARSLSGAQARDGRDDLGDDLAGAPHDDRVADEHALARDLVGVVQRRHRDGDAADAHRLEHRERRHGAGAADADLDVAAASSSAPRPGTCRRSPSAGTSRSRRARLASAQRRP